MAPDSRISSPTDNPDGGSYRVTGPTIVVTPAKVDKGADPPTTWTKVGTNSHTGTSRAPGT
jgi:hypothetical protein